MKEKQHESISSVYAKKSSSLNVTNNGPGPGRGVWPLKRDKQVTPAVQHDNNYLQALLAT